MCQVLGPAVNAHSVARKDEVHCVSEDSDVHLLQDKGNSEISQDGRRMREVKHGLENSVRPTAR